MSPGHASRGALVALIALIAAPLRAQDAPAPLQVVEVLTATGTVHDVVHQPSGPDHPARLLFATDGGLVVREGGDTRLLTAGLPGARLRSVSLVGDALWVGGVEGTARLDAGTLEVRERRPERRVRRALSFGGATWLASFGGGLVRLADEASERVVLGRSHARRRLTDLRVVRVGEREELWVASAGAGVLRVAVDGTLLGRLTERSGLPDDHVWGLEADGPEVLAATLDGLGVVRAGEDVRAAQLRFRTDPAAARLPIRDLRAVRALGEHRLVAAYGAGVYRLEGGQARRIGAAGLRPLALAETGEGAVAGFADGARRVTASGFDELHVGALPSPDVTSLERAFGRVWIGTFSGGLATLRGGAVRAETRASERWHVDGRINDLAVTRSGGERLWIATDRGLHVHDGRVFSRVEDPEAPGRVHVTSLHVDAEGGLWVTSARLLAHRDPSGRWESWGGDDRFPVMQLHAVTRDATGRVWVGSLHGLFAFDPRDTSQDGGPAFERFTVSSGDLPVDWVTALATVGGRVVAGTYHGGLAWQRAGGGLLPEREGASLPAGWVNPHALRVLGGRLYVGTMERGLLIGRRGAWTRLTTAEGLPSDDVTDVLPAGEDVWVATRGGLARVRR
ncbi:MAG: hypothetical protein AAGH15_05275 [Myxococcota bacterium]